MLDNGLHQKIEKLREGLSKYRKVAVAFSGGVDSTVVLDNCCNIFEPEQIIAFHARSCLQADRVESCVQNVLSLNFNTRCRFEIVECDPLGWPDFVKNTQRRCYFCKKRTFTLLLEKMALFGCDVLLDGTNKDDLNEYRPGLKALEELHIVSPLLDAGINKSEVRLYAKIEGLTNHSLPSDSCLATRIAPHTQITNKVLKIIEESEDFLASLGFVGARVKPEKDRVFIEVQASDITKVVEFEARESILQFIKNKGLGIVFLDITGR